MADVVRNATTHKVTAHAAGPVMVVPHSGTWDPDGPVVVGVDDAEHSVPAVEWAFDDASREHSPGGARSTRTCSSAPAVVRGHPATVLQDISAAARLVVVGSRGQGGFAGLLLASVSSRITQHAHCPVVVVPVTGRQSGA